MKVTKKTEKNNTVPFTLIEQGDLFLFNDSVFIKTSELTVERNAVELETGDGNWFFYNEKVTPLDGELVWYEKEC